MFNTKQDFAAWYERSPAGRRCSDAVTKASDADREWFEAHPAEDYYVRAPFPDEFPPLSGGSKPHAVLVQQVKPGFRMRFPLVDGGA